MFMSEWHNLEISAKGNDQSPISALQKQLTYITSIFKYIFYALGKFCAKSKLLVFIMKLETLCSL